MRPREINSEEALEQMRPAGDVPRDPPPREWYPYMILHDACVNGKQNPDIMHRLYISEGTFDRTRRDQFAGTCTG